MTAISHYQFDLYACKKYGHNYRYLKRRIKISMDRERVREQRVHAAFSIFFIGLYGYV